MGKLEVHTAADGHCKRIVRSGERETNASRHTTSFRFIRPPNECCSARARARKCAASRARRASGREAAIRNFYFVLFKEMRGRPRKLQTDLLVKLFFTKRYVRL